MSAPFNIDNDITHAPSIGDTGKMREADDVGLSQSKVIKDPALNIREKETGTAARGRPPQLPCSSQLKLKRARARVTHWTEACPDSCGRVCVKRRQKRV